MKIELSGTTRSKEHRMLSARQIKKRVKNLEGTLYSEGDHNRYHLVKRDIDLVLVKEGDTITVVTQKHLHGDNFQKSNFYQRRNKIEEKERMTA